MKRIEQPRGHFGWLVFAIGICLGCNVQPSESKVDAERVRTTRASLLLADEPEQAIGVTELREQLQQAAAPVETTVVGRIATKQPSGVRKQDGFPWDEGHAAFVLSDAASDEHAHEHADGEECPFCAKTAAESRVLVQFVGSNGDPLDIDARELFELKGDEIVVVRGSVKDAAGFITLNAQGIYIRR